MRQAANYGAREAAAKNIVDVVSPTLPALLREIDGRVTKPKGIELHTAGASVDTVEMSFFQKARDLLIDPNIIALMLSLGIVGLLVELWNPGLVLPGTVGAISLIVGLYGLQVLPVSVAGALMLLVSLGLFVTDALVTAHGALEPRRRGHVRDRRADAVRPGRPRVPGLVVDRPRHRRHARAPDRRRAVARSSGPGGTPSRRASGCSSARRPRCAQEASSP